VFSTLATESALTDNLSAGIPIEIKELTSSPTSSLTLAALSACLLALPAEELTATRVNLVSGAFSNAALTAPNKSWWYFSDSDLILNTAIGFGETLD
jgi:hypothetical protein